MADFAFFILTRPDAPAAFLKWVFTPVDGRPATLYCPDAASLPFVRSGSTGPKLLGRMAPALKELAAAYVARGSMFGRQGT